MPSAVVMRDVTVRRGAALLLDHVSWTVDEGERWVVLGPNGAGKTTLLLVAATRLFPSSGEVELLGDELGAVPVFELRTRIGWASAALAADVPARELVSDVVLTGAQGVTGRWRDTYDAADTRRAGILLAAWGLAALASRTFGTLSEGERKRALIARSLMANPELVLLDEPGAGLDLGGREDLVARLHRLAADPAAPTSVLVTHHVEEIPDGFTHALLLRGGRVVAAGPLDDVLTSDVVSATFEISVVVDRTSGRWHARRR